MTDFEFDVFLCHNSKDKPAVSALAERLKKRGVKVWYDDWNIIAGDHFLQKIEQGIGASRTVAFLVGGDGIGPWQEGERNMATQLMYTTGRRQIPVLLPTAPSAPELPLSLRSVKWEDLRSGGDPKSLEGLIKAIKHDRGRRRADQSELGGLDISALEQRLKDSIGTEFPRLRNGLDQNKLAEYGELFSLLLETRPPQGARGDQFFEWIYSQIVKSQQKVPVIIEARRGAGKTSLLLALYWYLARQRASGGPLPVYFDIMRYTFAGRLEDDGRDAAETAKDLILDLLEPLSELIKRNSGDSLVLIIDSFESSPYSAQLTGVLLEIVKPAGDVKLVGVPAHYDPETASVALFRQRPVLRLGRVPVNDPRCAPLMEAFSKVAHPEQSTQPSKLEALASKFELTEWDLFMLSSIHAHPQEQNLSGVLERCCWDDLQVRVGMPHRIAESLDIAARLAFHMTIPSYSPNLKKDDEKVLRILVRRHPGIADYLQARFHINSLEEIAQGNLSALPYLDSLFDHRVGKLAKEMVNSEDRRAEIVLSSLKRIFSVDSNAGEYAKSNICYLAGRVAIPHFKKAIREQLRGYKDRVTESLEESSCQEKVRMLHRTLHVSLIILGDNTARDEYIESLLSDECTDNLNRGFHLEYYGDQKYRRDPDEPLASDDLLGPFPKTFTVLASRIGEKNNRMFELELQTLCSLAQHRHAEQRLAADQQQQLIELLEGLLKQNRIRHTGLRAFAALVHKHLGCDRFEVGSQFAKIYGIKQVDRTGWLERGLQHPESVADHMYGSFLIGLFFLKDDDPGYSKDKILNMLLIHDLGEAIVGDKTPKDRTDPHKKKEQEAIDEISLLGTYTEFGSLRRIQGLSREFEAEQTVDARIAKDIDRIENWVQLWTYGKQKVDRFDEFDESLRQEIKTEKGGEILEILTRTYCPDAP